MTHPPARSAAAGLRVFALVAFLALLVLRLVDPVSLQITRERAFDVYQQLHPRQRAAGPVVIVDINDEALRRYGQWPWPRTRIAQALEIIAQAGPAVIGVDILFPEPDRLSPEMLSSLYPELAPLLAQIPAQDTRLAQAIARGRVVLGQSSARYSDVRAPVSPSQTDVPHGVVGKGAREALPRFPVLIPNLPILEQAAHGHGVLSVLADPDGIYRAFPLAVRAGGVLRLALGAEMLRIATGGNAVVLKAHPRGGLKGMILAGALIPTAPNGEIRPWYGPSDPSRFIAIADVLEGKVPAAALRGRLVLLGTTAIGLEDYRTTPLATAMPGVEIHAQLLENILGKTTLSRPGSMLVWELLATLLLAGALMLAAVKLGARGLLGVTALVLFGYVGLSYALFRSARLLLDPTFPTLTTAFLAALALGANYLREERRKQQIRAAFTQYVSPALAQQLADHPEKLRLGGEQRELTVLFCDVAGFTRIAERWSANPEQLTRLMNRLLTALSEEVLKEGGTIDKYMGDAIMAFWNAPTPCPNHAEAACRAALGMQERLDRLNVALRAEDPHRHQPLRAGIGINTGLCVVGNMGSDMRFDYTALGDSVNLASRLEQYTRKAGVSVLLGEGTARALDGAFELRDLGETRVRGKQNPVRIYELPLAGELESDR